MTLNNSKAFSLLAQGLEEFARLVGIMIALLTAAWFLGSSAAEQFVVNIVNRQNFAVQSEVVIIKEQVKQLDRDQNSLAKTIEHLNAQVGDLKELATEERSTLTQILFALKKT